MPKHTKQITAITARLVVDADNGSRVKRRRSRRSRRRLTLVALTALVALLTAGGVAQAYWGGSGTGSATGSTGTAISVTLSPGTPTATLYPGGRTDVAVRVSNPGAAGVFIGSLALDPGEGTGGFAVDAGHAGCAVATLTFTTQRNAGAGWTVPASANAVDGTLSVNLTNALAMGADAANACQGAVFSVYLVAGP